MESISFLALRTAVAFAHGTFMFLRKIYTTISYEWFILVNSAHEQEQKIEDRKIVEMSSQRWEDKVEEKWKRKRMLSKN